jgi:phosphatidylserine/phosphatidylglycerophosphate/cardiolipin synthase-like enzyme
VIAEAFAQAAVRAIEGMGPRRLRIVTDGIRQGISDAALANAMPTGADHELARAVREGQRASGLGDDVAAAYLDGLGAAYVRHAERLRVETVWSGPKSHAVPVRSTAEVLVDLVGEAQKDLLLMTYSAKPHPPVIESLIAARARGVQVSVVVETLQGAGGAIGGPVEPATAFQAVPGVELWHWPPAARSDSGAKMHAKVAVADGRALLVSSANLTQSGVKTNVEAGVLVRGGTAPERAAEHVRQLIATGVLVRLLPGEPG